MKYIFWEQYNAQKISGLPKLIIMCVKALSTNNNVVLISQKTSLVYKVLNDEKILFDHIDENKIEETKLISSNDILIVPALNKKLFILDKFNPKILLWQIYPSICCSNKIKKLLLKFQFKKILKENGFISMDITCLNTISNELGLDFSKSKIVPMPIDHHEYKYSIQKSKVESKQINISYLGRAVIWKIQPLIRLLKDIHNLNDFDFIIHIFTDNSKIMNDLISPYITYNCKAIYYEGLYGDSLLNKLKNVDLHYAMGISAVEGSSLGIPTLVAPLSYNEIKDGYKYHWIYEDIEHYAGDLLENDLNKNIGHVLSEIITNIKDKDALNDISQKCFKSTEIFSLSAIEKELVNCKTTLKLRDCEKRMFSYWIYLLKKLRK